MLPSERSERWTWRLGLTVLVLMALFILVWLVGFISRTFRQAVQQRELPPDTDAPFAENS